MQIGELYKTKACWFLFSTLSDAQSQVGEDINRQINSYRSVAGCISALKRQLGNPVSFIDANSIIVPLEESKGWMYDTSYVKVLTGNGQVGWIILAHFNKTRVSKKS